MQMPVLIAWVQRKPCLTKQQFSIYFVCGVRTELTNSNMLYDRKIFLEVFQVSRNVVESSSVNIIGMVLYMHQIGTPLCHWTNHIHRLLQLTLIINCTKHFE